MDTYLLPDSQRLEGARRRLWEGESLPADLLPPSVARSWERSRDAGVCPWEPRFAHGNIPVFSLDAADRHLAACVKPEIERLWQVFGGQSLSLFCVNADGVIVHSRHAPTGGPLDALHVGRRVQESDIGTTG